MSTSRSTEAPAPSTEDETRSPSAEQREYSIDPDRLGGLPRDFVEAAEEDEAPRSRFSEGARTLLHGVGFGAGFGLIIEGFRLAAWMVAPGLAP